MEEAFKEGKELVFFVSENKRPDSKAKATLAVTISQKPQNSGYGNRGGGNSGSPFTAPAQPAAPAPTPSFVQPRTRTGSTKATVRENPPKDELESFLESFDKE